MFVFAALAVALSLDEQIVSLCRGAGGEGVALVHACCDAQLGASPSSTQNWCCSASAVGWAEPARICLHLGSGADDAWLHLDAGISSVKLLARREGEAGGKLATKGSAASLYRARLEQSAGAGCANAGCSPTTVEELSATVAKPPPPPRSHAEPARATSTEAIHPPPKPQPADPPPVRAPRKLSASSFTRR